MQHITIMSKSDFNQVNKNKQGHGETLADVIDGRMVRAGVSVT